MGSNEKLNEAEKYMGQQLTDALGIPPEKRDNFLLFLKDYIDCRLERDRRRRDFGIRD